MARAEIDGRWVNKIHALAETEEGRSAAKIEKKLAEDAAKEGRSDYPSMRSIGRILRMHRNMSERERAIYREFHWPQSMMTGLVPWEASRLALDLLKFYLLEWKLRPTVEEVIWYWRVYLASPQSPPERLRAIASLTRSNLADIVTMPDWADWDWSLAFEPWLDDSRREVYDQAFPHRPWPVLEGD